MSRKHPARQRRRQRRGVTLVEVTVVLSVLLLLASITVPVRCTSPGPTKVVSCKNNLNQIHAALFTYAQAYGQRFPGRWNGYTVKKVQDGIFSIPARLQDDLFPPDFDVNDLRGDDDLGPLYALGYAPDLRIFNCPATQHEARRKPEDDDGNPLPKGYDLMFKATERRYTSIAEYRARKGTGPTGQLSYEYPGEAAPGLHVAGDIDAERAWLAHDIDDREGTKDWEVDGDNHGDAGGNVLFIDGRAEWIIAADWTKTLRNGHDERLMDIDIGARKATIPEDAVRGEWDKQTGWPNPALDVKDIRGAEW